VRLHIEKIRSKNSISFNFIQHDLTTEMLMPKIKVLFTDGICPNLIPFELFPIMSNNFLNFFVNSLKVVRATLQPLLLTIIFQLKNCVRNNIVNQIGIGRRDGLRLALSSNVEMQGQEKNVFVKF